MKRIRIEGDSPELIAGFVAGVEWVNLKTAVEARREPFSGREIHGSGAAIRLRRRGQRDRSV